MKSRHRWILGALAIGCAAGVLSHVLRADEDWVLLSPDCWEDEFNPMYTNSQGQFLSGNPIETDEEETPPAIISYEVLDPDSGEWFQENAVQNEFTVSFAVGTPALSVRTLFESMNLDILGAWWEPDEEPESNIMWFHGGIGAASAFHDDVPALLTLLRARPDVTNADYNTLESLCLNPPYAANNNPNTPNPNPNDQLLPDAGQTDPDFSYFRRLNIDTAWAAGTTVNWTNITDHRSCVLVMDTGIDADHPDLSASIYRLPANDPTGVTQRHAIVARKGRTLLWTMADTAAGQDIDPNGPDPRKVVSFRRRGHGHGTAMAGIIGAQTDNNGVGVAACGPTVMVMSARMRMPANDSVDFASAPKIIRTLRRFYGQNARVPGQPATVTHNVTDINTVYIGWAQNAFDGNMSTLLRLMRRDFDAGNDRVYVTPSGNTGRTTATFPSGLLAGNRGRFFPINGGPGDPEILGVCGATFSNSDARPHADQASFFSNRFVPTTNLGYHDVYDVSGYIVPFEFSTDVADGTYRANSLARATPPGRIGYAGANTAGEPAGPNFAHNFAFTGGGITGTLTGTSSSAAEIAALCGLLWKQHPPTISGGNGTSAILGEHIRRNLKTGAAPIFSTVTLPLPRFMAAGTFNYTRINTFGANNTVTTVPSVPDFNAALTNNQWP